MRRYDARDIVLIVDDSPDTLSVLTDAIEDAGMTVLVAREGEHALAIVEKVTPDVILMDAVMPGTDGFATCRRLKQSKALAHVPVIFMTGLSDTEHIIEGLEAGGVDYITKPIVPGELLARIRVHRANARMAHSARTALDAFGRFLLAASLTGRVLWCTPQASKLLGTAFKDFDTEDYLLPADVQVWLHQCAAADAASMPDSIDLTADRAPTKLRLVYVGAIGPDENLLRLIDGEQVDEQTVLKQKLLVTEREAEVLLWIARGKSNRDIAEILSLSPRTVNKHLEQIYAKLGVENRTSAAALAMRTIGLR
ncbi:MAG: response regulator [Hyphomicrobiales bacterium]|nr:response regulator [Hyphomicrobiales bacterium]MBV8823878.1 response regulator [Hyphomicrobiales bacterium]